MFCIVSGNSQNYRADTHKQTHTRTHAHMHARTQNCLEFFKSFFPDDLEIKHEGPPCYCLYKIGLVSINTYSFVWGGGGLTSNSRIFTKVKSTYLKHLKLFCQERFSKYFLFSMQYPFYDLGLSQLGTPSLPLAK